jgi:protein-S-isoprenylcysteine O-methyltransferase Ste14
MRTKQILPPTYLLVALVIMLAVHFIFPGVTIIPLPWIYLGLIPLGIGIILNLNADRLFHQLGTTVKPFKESTVLITDGVYKISRHPMYLGFVLILAGVAILLGSLALWIIIPIFVLVMEVIFIRVEERMLAEKFGIAWTKYKNRVHRWI